MNEDDRDYYRRRAAREREIATICEDGAAVLVHLQLADAYDAKLQAAEPPRRRSP